MTLNGEMALILRFSSFWGEKLVNKAIANSYALFTITVSSSKRLQKVRATPTV